MKKRNVSGLGVCDPEIYRKGKRVCVIPGDAQMIEVLVLSARARANARVDWHHFCSGFAEILHLGNRESRKRLVSALQELGVRLPAKAFS